MRKLSHEKYCVKVPGKLFIAGEYAVLEPDQPAIVIAVNRYISIEIERSSQNQLSLPQLGLDLVTWERKGNQLQFSTDDLRLRFVQQAIYVAEKYLHEKGIDTSSFKLTVISELDDPSGRKYGLGSSAAIVVGVVSAILKLNESETITITQEELFKASTIAHFQTQGSGSGADIAASTYGGWICYTSFQSRWLIVELEKGDGLKELIEKPWPSLSITPLSQPSMLTLYVGWTGKVAGTGPLVKQIQEWGKSHSELFEQFLQESDRAVSKVVRSFESDDRLGAIEGLIDNRLALKRLGEQANVPIETPSLQALATIAEKFGGAGKSSGAGGGDCGIALVGGSGQANKMVREWKKVGIQPLDLEVSMKGAVSEAIWES